MALTVGALIPVYNRPDGLRYAIDSVINQDRPPEQIVVVDDASAVPVTLPDLAHYKGDAQVIRLPSNRGPANARQVGIEALTTTHVAFLDSDDRWLPAKLSRQLETLARFYDDENVAIGCGWRVLNSDGRWGRAIAPVGSDRLQDFVSGCWYCPGSTVLMSRAAILRAGGFDPRLRRLEDLDLFIRFALQGGRLEVVPVAGATIRKGRNAKIETVYAAASILERKFSKSGSSELDASSRRRLLAWLALERAAAARNDGRALEVYGNLLRSFALAPRLRVQLENWYSTLPD